MIKLGEYTCINGKEYKVILKDRNGKSYIISDKNEPDFQKYAEGIYEKEINLEQLENLYYITPKAEYEGNYFMIRPNMKNGEICLGTTDSELAQQLKFERTDKYLYEKWVSESEVDIIEERKDLSLN
ncbi:hypothetical protein [Listeria seeligeri]|uniref:hypothetical protein n=1 Tax=Listeria seeligeri TaxID=1640 RepID=UPI0022EBC201|nr:hypothetical protein [Listeria seeligeri]